MKYKCVVKINAPIEEVVKLWKDESKFKYWQDDFKSIEHLTGIPNTEGATAKIVFEGKMKIELLETILKNDLPHEKTGLYVHKHMTNTQTSKFETLATGGTSYSSEVEYTQFNGFMIKLMAKWFPGKFKAQSQKWMDQFKVFAEKEINTEL